MSAAADRLTVVKQWVQKAENDFRNAEHTLKMQVDCPYDTVCYHAQQVVEKYLKALLTFHSIDFPKIHDIGELVAFLPRNVKIPLTPLEQSRFTDYAVSSRYPGDWEPLTRNEAEEALALAQKVRAVMKTLLN